MCALFVPGSRPALDAGPQARVPDGHCPGCGSSQTREADQPTPRAALFSPRMPRLRWRYCPSCGDHYLAVLPKRRRTPH